MRIRIKSNRDVWAFCVMVTLISITITEVTLTLSYLYLGNAAFSKTNMFTLGFIVPILVSLPVCYYMARIAQQLSLAHSSLRHLADTDELTGLINRRSFFAKAAHELREAESIENPLSLLVIDADFFKQLNDTYGHATGDAALQFITEKLQNCVRKSDLVCRLGGEEFAILLPNMDEDAASKLADRILKKISSQPMVFDNKIIEMSVSCGIADSAVSYEMTTLFKAADDALYAAKEAGRNQTVLYSSYLDRNLSLTGTSPYRA